MAPEELNEEMLIRLDENVKHIRSQLDEVLEKQGELKTRVQSNESDVENLDDDVRWNRKIYIGGLLLSIVIFIVTNYIFQGGV